MRHNERIPWRIPALLTAALCLGVGLTYCDHRADAATPPPFDSTTKGKITVVCDGNTTPISTNTAESEATAAALNYAIAHGGKATCTMQLPSKVLVFALPTVAAPAPTPTPTPSPAPPTPSATLQFATSVGGAYSQLDGATIASAINVRLSSQALELSPCAFSIDGADLNVEYGAPYDVEGDDILVTYSPGPHTVQAKCVGLTVSAKFNVVTPTGSQPPPSSGALNAVLTWIPPTKNSDGSTLTNLAGYVIYYGTSLDALMPTINIPSPSITSYIVQGLSSGVTYFAIRATTTDGIQSGFSNVVSKTL